MSNWTSASRPRVDLIERSVNPEVEAFAKQQGIGQMAARIVAGRINNVADCHDFLNATLSNLDDPGTLPDVGKAADRILKAITSGESIFLSPDTDSDGTCSGAVLWQALNWFGVSADRLKIFASHRMREGYGLNADLTKRILAEATPGSLLITADSGTSDNSRIEVLKNHSIDTIVTDHHGLDQYGAPAAAYAFVSPLRPDSQYRDRYICGVMVAWLLMAEVRRRGMKAGLLPENCPSMTGLIGMCAIGTVADCVSLSSKNNRAIVRAGLQHLQKSPLPFCQAIREEFCKDGKIIDEEMIGFQIAPRLAACGRLDESAPGIRFLLSSTIEEARILLKEMTAANEQRKQIQQAMGIKAMALAQRQVSAGNVGIAVYLDDGVSGVHGINSARITEHFGLPSAMLSPMLDRTELISISCRGGDLCNVKSIIDRMKETEPGLLLAGGGHVAAGGAKIAVEEVSRFQFAWDRLVREQLGTVTPCRRIRTDGVLPDDRISMQTIHESAFVGPYGKGFDAPIWLGDFKVSEAKRIGKDGTHLSVVLAAKNLALRGVWFRAMETESSPMPVRGGEMTRAAYKLTVSEWKGKQRLEAMIETLRPTLGGAQTQLW